MSNFCQQIMDVFRPGSNDPIPVFFSYSGFENWEPGMEFSASLGIDGWTISGPTGNPGVCDIQSAFQMGIEDVVHGYAESYPDSAVAYLINHMFDESGMSTQAARTDCGTILEFFRHASSVAGVDIPVIDLFTPFFPDLGYPDLCDIYFALISRDGVQLSHDSGNFFLPADDNFEAVLQGFQADPGSFSSGSALEWHSESTREWLTGDAATHTDRKLFESEGYPAAYYCPAKWWPMLEGYTPSPKAYGVTWRTLWSPFADITDDYCYTILENFTDPEWYWPLWSEVILKRGSDYGSWLYNSRYFAGYPLVSEEEQDQFLEEVMGEL